MTQNIPNVDLTPTEIALRLSKLVNSRVSNRQVNQLLEELGLQKKLKTRNGKSKWQLTQKGQKYGRVYLVTNTQGNWSGNQIKWSEEVINLLQPESTSLTA
ncbi:MAG: hypothetical protein NTY89_22330 [Nostocales cyanobacterium LacPavin_0920_SED1_MAG_38_18]|jgi:hypothetical protein|nr:hypothetical protein [Nostocales cyanobacterium LacPavin_0920_SED1_MAG_38_18]